jgi:hypothetical protein
MKSSTSLARKIIQVTPTQLLLGGAVAFLLGGYVFASGWFDWASLFRAHPLLSIPSILSLFVAPTLLYISLREMTEAGARIALLLSAFLSVSGMGLVVAGLNLWLRNIAG